MKTYYVYILANRSRTLYTGVTNDLEMRLRQHRAGTGSEFTARYNITRLVFYESFNNIHDAIAWEKRIKGWTRVKKIALITERNEHWKDLSAEWVPSGPAVDRGKQDPSSLSAPAVTGARDPSQAQDDAFGMMA